MSLITAQWCDLKEPVELRARNIAVAEALRAWFLKRSQINVVDIAGGTGANLRATAPLLPEHQSWLLVEKDHDLLAAGRVRLQGWADTAEDRGSSLVLGKGTQRIEVRFLQTDIAMGLSDVLRPGTDLIAVSGLFERTSLAFIRRLAAAADKARAAIYATAIYNGQWSWSPRHPADREMLAAFHRFQMKDHGFGGATGPTAAVEFSETFVTQGFGISDGASPWRLAANDAVLVAELANTFAAGVAETGVLPKASSNVWLTRSKSGAEIGHIDQFAIPPTGKDAALDLDDEKD